MTNQQMIGYLKQTLQLVTEMQPFAHEITLNSVNLFSDSRPQDDRGIRLNCVALSFRAPQTGTL